MANEYQTSAALKATLELTGETFADADVALALTAASRGIDQYTHRRFYADGDTSQVRVYSPWEKDLLRIDDLITLTSLKTDPGGDNVFENTWVLNDDFVLEPLNPELVDGTVKEPWTLIRRHPNADFEFTVKYPRTVQVTGKFGWPVVPDAIKTATVILAAKLLKRTREAPFGVVTVGIDAGAAMRIARTDPDVRFLADPYVRGKVASLF